MPVLSFPPFLSFLLSQMTLCNFSQIILQVLKNLWWFFWWWLRSLRSLVLILCQLRFLAGSCNPHRRLHQAGILRFSLQQLLLLLTRSQSPIAGRIWLSDLASLWRVAGLWWLLILLLLLLITLLFLLQPGWSPQRHLCWYLLNRLWSNLCCLSRFPLVEATIPYWTSLWTVALLPLWRILSLFENACIFWSL